jgi:hypothetical protein
MSDDVVQPQYTRRYVRTKEFPEPTPGEFERITRQLQENVDKELLRTAGELMQDSPTADPHPDAIDADYVVLPKAPPEELPPGDL